MKKVLLIAMIFTIGTTTVSAQRMKKDMSLVNVGLGLIPGVGLNASYDYGLVDTWGPGIFTVGAYLGFGNWSDNYAARDDYRTTQLFFAPRATYRYAIEENFEVYAALMLGAKFRTYSEYYKNSTIFDAGFTAGCRYSFAHNISLFAELGYNVSFINLGMTFAF